MPSIFVYFLVDTEALDIYRDDMNAQEIYNDHVNASKRLIMNWKDHGVLVCLEESLSASKLINKVETLPQNVRKMWQEALRHNRHTIVRFRLPDIETLDEIARIRDFVGKANLLCLENTKADLLADMAGLNGYEGRFHPPGIEIEVVRFGDSDQSESFIQARQFANRPIMEGERVDNVWRERFAPFLDIYKHGALVDKYALIEHDEIIHKDNKNIRSGIYKLLSELGSHEIPHCFKIIAATNVLKKQSHEYFESLLTQLFNEVNRGGIRRLEFYGLDERAFSHVYHDRFLRFQKTICTLGYGINVLTGAIVPRMCDFSVKTDEFSVKQYNEKQQQLQKKAKLSVIYDADSKN